MIEDQHNSHVADLLVEIQAEIKVEMETDKQHHTDIQDARDSLLEALSASAAPAPRCRTRTLPVPIRVRHVEKRKPRSNSLGTSPKEVCFSKTVRVHLMTRNERSHLRSWDRSTDEMEAAAEVRNRTPVHLLVMKKLHRIVTLENMLLHPLSVLVSSLIFALYNINVLAVNLVLACDKGSNRSSATANTRCTDKSVHSRPCAISPCTRTCTSSTQQAVAEHGREKEEHKAEQPEAAAPDFGALF
eukprot:scpid68433/ scgid24971/ 